MCTASKRVQRTGVLKLVESGGVSVRPEGQLYEIEVVSGEAESLSASGMPPGTTVKFFTSPKTEGWFAAYNVERSVPPCVASAATIPLPDKWRDGVVKWFSPDPGYGFVAVNDFGADAYLPRHVLEKSRLEIKQATTGLEVRVKIAFSERKPGKYAVQQIDLR